MPQRSPSTRARLARARRAVRRALLRRRRLLAGLLTAVAVATGLASVAAPPPTTTAVMVAVRDLAPGTRVSADDLVATAFAPGSVPHGVVAAPEGVVLAGAVRAGEAITDVRVVGPDLVAGRHDLVATPVRLPDAGMVDLLRVGDLVDLVAADPRTGTSAVVADDLPVLALPTDDETPTASGLPGRLVVLGAGAGDVGPIAEAAVVSFVTFTWSIR